MEPLGEVAVGVNNALACLPMPTTKFMRPTDLSPVTLVRMLRRRSQRETAYKLGISRARLSQIEAGREPPYALMRKIAKELDVEVEVLFPEDGGKQLRKDLRSQLGITKRRRKR